MSISNHHNQEHALDVIARATRQKVLKSGKITYGNGYFSTQCLVRDLSPTGVKLKLLNDLPVPDSFYLEMESEGIAVECRIRRRNGMEVGASFDGPVQVTGAAMRQNVVPTVSCDEAASRRGRLRLRVKS